MNWRVTRDGSLLIGAGWVWTRLLVGLSYVDVPFTDAVRMRIITLNLLWAHVSFTHYVRIK